MKRSPRPRGRSATRGGEFTFSLLPRRGRADVSASALLCVPVDSSAPAGAGRRWIDLSTGSAPLHPWLHPDAPPGRSEPITTRHYSSIPFPSLIFSSLYFTSLYFTRLQLTLLFFPALLCGSVVKPSFLSGIQPTHAQNATDRACARSAWVGAGDKPSSVGPGGFRVPLPGWRTCRRVRPFLCARACAWAGAVYPPPAARTGRRAGEPARGAVRPCTRWGLPCPDAHAPGGGLLPRRFTLA